MFVHLLLLCFAAVPPDPDTIPRWIPDLPHPAELRGVWLTSATRAMLTDPDVKARRSATAAVSVNDTRVTIHGLDKLQKALPNCRIVHDWPMYVGRHAI